MTTSPQSDTPPQPSYILRGHNSAIHSLTFTRSNTRLISGDAEGWVVIWDVAIRRPVAVWRAHESVVLEVRAWGPEKVVTHGRDGRVSVWKLGVDDEGSLSKALPAEQTSEHRSQPWMLHTLTASSLTFCSFDMCPNVSHSSPSSTVDEVLLAVPGETDSTVEVYHLPSEKQIASIPAPASTTVKTGLVMAMKIMYLPDGKLHMAVGYESGRTCLFRHVEDIGQWEMIYTARPHEQPILGLDVAPSTEYYLTSGADAVVAKHPLIGASPKAEALKTVQTKHAGQQGLRMRSDGRVFAIGGWDGRARVYSAKTMKELAVLKWHKGGCYVIAFAEVAATKDTESTVDGRSTELTARAGGSMIYTVAQNRSTKAQTTHWVAVGSKDGKISLWDIY